MENETDLFEFLGYESINDFIKSDFGKKRIKRKPTEKTLEQIHDTWRRTEERANKRIKQSNDLMMIIINEIPKNDKGEHVVYYNNDNILYNYTFKYDNFYKSYLIGNNLVELPSGSNVDARNERLEFLLSNNKAFDFGEQYRKLEKYESRKHYYFKRKFTDIVQDKLREEFKNTKASDLNTINIVQVSDKKYYFILDDQHKYGWKVFHYSGEFKENTIKL